MFGRLRARSEEVKPQNITLIDSRRGNEPRESNWTTRGQEAIIRNMHLMRFANLQRLSGVVSYRERQGVEKRQRDIDFRPNLEAEVARRLGADPVDFHLRPATLEDVIDAASTTEKILKPTVLGLKNEIADLRDELAKLHQAA